MKKKLKKLSSLVDEIKYENLKNEHYLECGFDKNEADILNNIYFELVFETRREIEGELEYIVKLLDVTDDIKLRYYFLAFTTSKVTKRKKYNMSRELINLTLDNKDSIYDFTDNVFVERKTLSHILSLSSMMKIRKHELLDLVYEYSDKTGEFYTFTESISHAVHNENEDLKKKFQSLYDSKIKNLVSQKDEYSLNNLMIKLEKDNKFFNHKLILEPLSYLRYELGLKGKSMNDILLLTKASEGFHLLGYTEMEKKALVLLEKAIINNEIQWKSFGGEYNDKLKKQIQEKLENLDDFFHQTSIREVVNMVGDIVYINYKDFLGDNKKKIIYEPYTDINIIRQSETGLLTAGLFKQVSIGKNRLLKNRESGERFRDTYYQNHFDWNVLPVMRWFYINNILFLKEVRELIYKNAWISESTKGYYLRIEKYYSFDTSFEFVHFTVIFIEKLFRDLYKELAGKQILINRTNKSTQSNLNLQDIMKSDEMKDFLSHSLYEYTKYILIDELGLNLRNELLHGISDTVKFGFGYSQILLHFVLVIINFAKNSFEDNE